LEKIEREIEVREKAERRAAPVSREPVIERGPEAPTPAPPGDVTFVLTDVTLQGNTALQAGAFAPIIDRYRNRKVTVDDLKALADAIEAEYRRQGYVTALAYLPPQRIEGGRAIIEVLEGRVGELLVEGNRYFNASRFRWYWPLETGELLRYDAMRRSLVRMNEHPDRQVQALLRPGRAAGTTDVVLKVSDRLPAHLSAQWDNQGTKPIGRHRAGFSASHNNLLGLDDRAVLGTSFGREFGAVYAQYAAPVTPHGTSAAFSFSHSRVSPKRQFRDFGVNGRSQTYGVRLEQALVDRQRVSLSGFLGLAFKESRTMVSSGTSRRDRLRVLSFGPHLQILDPWGRWIMDHEYAFGLKGLGASSENNPVASRQGADPDFFKTELRLTRVQRMPWQTQANLSVEVQASPSKLTPQEELYLGGSSSVRGYPEGDYLADQGIVVRLEYLVPCRFLPAEWQVPGSGQPLRDQVQLVAFLDRGYGRLRAITGEERSSRNLMGLGTGVRVRLKDDLSARVEWGVNVGDRPLTDDSRYALHLGLQYDL
jgi:hemolysin activation/secretion protein